MSKTDYRAADDALMNIRQYCREVREQAEKLEEVFGYLQREIDDLGAIVDGCAAIEQFRTRVGELCSDVNRIGLDHLTADPLLGVAEDIKAMRGGEE